MVAFNIQVEGKFMDGRTAVADINQDGQLDVIVTYNDHFSSDARIYVYTMFNGVPTLLAKTQFLEFQR